MQGSRTEIAVVHDGAFEPKEVVAGLEGYFSLREVALDDYLEFCEFWGHNTYLAADLLFCRLNQSFAPPLAAGIDLN